MIFDDDTQNPFPRVRPVIAWPGGKSRLLAELLPLVPEHNLYVEAFGGGLALFTAKQPSKLEVINDLNGELVNFYKQVKYHLDTLLDELEFVLNSREIFRDYIEQRGLTEIQRAARWYIRNKLSFGGMGASFGTSRGTSTASMGSRHQRLMSIRSFNARLDRTCIENLPWEKLFATYDHAEAFFFLDPPYLDAGGRAYQGWSEETLAGFCERVRALKGKFIFTFQDCPKVRELMAGYPLRAITRANGIGNRGRVREGRVYREVIIWSHLVPRRGKSIGHRIWAKKSRARTAEAKALTA